MIPKKRRHFKPLVQVSRRRDLALRVFIYLVLVSLALVMAYSVGQIAARDRINQAEAEVKVLTKHLERAEIAIADLNEELAVLKVAHQVQDSSSERSKTDLAKLQDEIAELRSLNKYYQSLMDAGSAKGVSVENVHIRKTIEGAWAVSSVVQQVASQHKRIKGELSVSVLVEREGGELAEIKLANQRLNFKYFQRYVTEVRFEDGTIPKELQLKLQLVGQLESITTVPWPQDSGDN